MSPTQGLSPKWYKTPSNLVSSTSSFFMTVLRQMPGLKTDHMYPNWKVKIFLSHQHRYTGDKEIDATILLREL